MEQGTQDWLELRKTKVTSTDASVLMYPDKYETPYQRWRKKKDLDFPAPENEAMRRGKVLEPVAREVVSRKLGVELIPTIRISQKVDWAMASLDGLSPDGKTLVEIKCPTTRRIQVVPDFYYPQLQHQLYVCELEKMYYFNFFEDNTFILEVIRDELYIKRMLEVEAEFYECMQNYIPPKLTSKDYVERNDSLFCKAALHWRDLDNQLKELEKKTEDARQSLILLAQNTNCKGFGVNVSKVVSKGRIGYSNIPELQGVDLEPHRGKPIESWRIS